MVTMTTQLNGVFMRAVKMNYVLELHILVNKKKAYNAGNVQRT